MPGHSPELKHSITKAGAGAGKTRGLVEKVAEVFKQYQQNQAWPRIVITTFTRKATQELKERLILKACRSQDADLLQFVTDPSRLQISTIHGLLNVFLRQLGHLAGLDAGFQIVSEREGLQLAKVALREALIGHAEGMAWLETYGFERVLKMCRSYNQVKLETGVLQAASLQDLEHAAQIEESKWRAGLHELGASILEEVDDSKWHDFAGALIEFTKQWSSNCPDLGTLPSKPRRSKSQEHLEAWHERAEGFIKQFKKEMGHQCWDRDLWPFMIAEWRKFSSFSECFASELQRLKNAQARFEMVDLELKSMEILRAKPFLGSVFAEGWDFWMIDEYQDTSPLQVACLQALIGEQPAYFVGDPQQSIYLFRGAEVRVFEEAEAAVRKRGGEAVELRRNYRSQPDLLMWINAFMTSVSPQFNSMEPREEPSSTDITRVCTTMIRAADDEQEMLAIVNRVGSLLESGVPLEQICVLGRTHRTLMDVSRALRERGFPTHVHSSRGFHSRREVLDAQALWKFLVNPHDNLNLLTLLRSPWFFTPDNLLGEWMESRPVSLWRSLNSRDRGTVPDSVERLNRALQMLAQQGLSRTFEESLKEAGYLDLSLVNDPAGRKESNLWKLIHKAHELEKEGGLSILDFLEQDSGSDQLDSSEGDATSAQEPNSINLMTIHGSKGLEFEHIIIPRMGDSPRTSNTLPMGHDGGHFFFPVWSDRHGEYVPSPLDYVMMHRQRARELEEFDRWLYVALTRAKSTLTLTWSKIGRDSWAERSPWFLLEAGRHQKDRHSFELLEGPFAEFDYKADRVSQAAVRPRWRESKTETTDRHSATSLATPANQKLKTEMLLNGWQSRTLGTGVHRALEALKYGHMSLEHDAGVEYVLNLETPPMRELMANGEAEWGFQVRTPNGVVEGQIDLWGIAQNRLFVVDYKSGSEAYKETAFQQLSLYAWALRKFGFEQEIELVVIYPLKQNVESRPFQEALFADWELKFSAAKT